VSTMDAEWSAFLSEGSLTGANELATPGSGTVPVVYWGLADAAPGEHVLVLAPAAWRPDEFGRGRGANEPRAGLTERELEVLRCAAEGLSAREVGERLVISESTVKTHLAHAYGKLRAPDRAAAVAEAMRLGLII
jgi:two-component system, NarL family, nitrate/nitrite response regulator NarL